MDKIVLPVQDRALLLECKVTTFRSSGRGGQHVNVTDSAVRLKHIPTGIVVVCQKQRSQYLNKKECLAKLRKKVKILNQIKPVRIPSRAPKSSIAKNKIKKSMHSKKKLLRIRPSIDTD